MKQILLLVLLAAACVSGSVMADNVPAEPYELDQLSELEVRQAIQQQASDIYATGDFHALEAQSDAYVASAERTPSGLWVSGVFVGGVINAIVSPRPVDSAGWDALEQRVTRWAKASPQSSLAHLMVAEVISRRAWSIRGGGFANTVSPDAWVPFRKHLGRARDYLIANEKVASGHPNYYAVLVEFDKSLGFSDEKIRKDFQAGLRRYPNYYPLHFAMLSHLLPKWHGGPGEIEVFAQAAVDATRALEGDGMYARIYWYAAQSEYQDALFLASFARWDRMRAGFEDVIARYPDQWNLQNYAHFACQVGDFETFTKLLPRLEAPIARAWEGRATFSECSRLAGQLDV